MRAAGNEDGLILLDLRDGRYLSFNPVGAMLWSRMVAGQTIGTITREFQELFEVPTEQIRQDVERILSVLLDKDLIHPLVGEAESVVGTEAVIGAEQPEQAGDGNEPSTEGGMLGNTLWCLLALLTLVYMDLLLLLARFPRFYRRLELPPRVLRRSPAASPEQIALAVDRAARFYFKRAWCLQRSAACVLLERRQGYPARLVLGVRVLPFEAHAWAELGGRPINEQPEVVERYLVLDRV